MSSFHASPAPPDKPSVAVLPFTNMSGDPEQEYVADGISEDLITDLSKISGLFVTARNSSFVFKGQIVDCARPVAKYGLTPSSPARCKRRFEDLSASMT